MIDLDKAALRDHYRSLRRELAAEEKAVSDLAVAQKFLNSEYYLRCRKLFMYISLPAEVDTFAILHAAWRDGKLVASPVCEPETHRMTFYRISGEEDLLTGHYGIREPDTGRCVPLEPDEDSLSENETLIE